MSAGKILNANKPLYPNIIRALSLDEVLPQLIALDGGNDAALISKKTGNTDATSFNAGQGLARNTTHWYAVQTGSISKYDLSSVSQAVNSDPFLGLPAGMNHCGGSFVDGNLLYVAISEWNGTVSAQACIAKFNISDLSLNSYFMLPIECGGSGCSLSPDGTEILVVTFTYDIGAVPANTDIYRFNKSAEIANGVYTLDTPSTGIQGITTDGTDYYITSWRPGVELYNGVYRYDSNFILKSNLNVETSGEIEDIEFYEGALYYGIKSGNVKSLSYSGSYESRNTVSKQGVKFLTAAEITDDMTIVIKVNINSIFNYNTVMDSLDYGQDWESWIYSDGRWAYREKNAQQVVSPNTVTGEYIVAFTRSKVGSVSTINLGINGVYVGDNANTAVANPSNGLYINGANDSNDFGDNVYHDVLVFDKALSDAELLEVNDNFDTYYIADGAPTAPIGTTTISSITPTTTTAEIAYAYDNTDETGYKYRLDGGVAVDVGTTNPFTITTGLTADTAYTVEVLAYNATGDGAYSSPATGFNTLAITSTLNITVSGIPDGTYMTVLDDETGTRLTRQNETYTGEALSVTLGLAVGTRVKGYVDDNVNPSVNGAYIEGVTV